MVDDDSITPHLVGPNAPRRRAPGKLRVLVVDDQVDTQKVLRSLILRNGHEVQICNDGAEAIARLTRPGSSPIDVVVCDLTMPRMNGDEFCTELQFRLGIQAPPVILVTGTLREDLSQLGSQVGAWHVMRKPVRAADLLRAIERAAQVPLGHGGPRGSPLRRVGPYEILDELGRGGMGIVYRARRDGTLTEVALKAFSTELPDPDDFPRFRREVDLLATLDHPGIARFLDQGVEEGIPFYVMELLPGHSLLTEIRRRGPLEPDHARHVGRDVAETLAYLHERKIIHRDVKPSNVVLRPDSTAALVDFGLARRPFDPDLTATHLIMGTPLYLAPEILREGRHSAPGDVYALGLTLLEALLGVHPLAKHRKAGTEASEGATIAILDGPIPVVPPARTLLPALPETLAAVLDRAVDPEPATRITAAELARALAALALPPGKPRS